LRPPADLFCAAGLEAADYSFVSGTPSPLVFWNGD
jgi:hypothetical protein